jgi:hypothetical protein
MSDAIISPALAAIAATSLPSRHATVTKLPDASEELFLRALSKQRLTGLACAAVAAGSLEVSDRAFEYLRERHLDQLTLDMVLEELLIEASVLLERSGIPYRALKGPVLAHTVYADPALRSFGDIDVLVPPGRFDDAIEALRVLGFERRFVEPRAGFDARFTKGACLERTDGLEVDLHRTLAPGAFGVRLAQCDFFASSPQLLDFGGVAVSGIDATSAFVHACFHAALGDTPPRLVPIRDVVQCFSAGIDETAVIEMATSTHCEVVFKRAFSLVDLLLQVRLEGVTPSWARAYQPTAFDRWALRTYTAANRSYSRQLAASFCALPTARDRAAYAMALAFPQHSYVRAREGSYAARLTRGVRVLRDAVRQ